jgi:hypothetical protein
MKNRSVTTVSLLLIGTLASSAALADRHGRYDHHHRGPHVGVVIHGSLYDPFYDPFFWPRYYPPYYHPYEPPIVAIAPPPVYIEQPSQPPTVQNESPSGYWYYCSQPDGYYPYVKQCPGGWQKVAPLPQSSR